MVKKREAPAAAFVVMSEDVNGKRVILVQAFEPLLRGSSDALKLTRT